MASARGRPALPGSPASACKLAGPHVGRGDQSRHRTPATASPRSSATLAEARIWASCATSSRPRHSSGARRRSCWACARRAWPIAEIVGHGPRRPTTPRGSSPARRPSRSRATGRLLLERVLAAQPGDLAFRTLGGRRAAGRRLGAHLAELRGVRINMEFNGALCRGLGRTRYKRTGCGRRRADAGRLHAGAGAAGPRRPPEQS